MWRALELRFVAIVVGASMPVLFASSVALFVVGSLEILTKARSWLVPMYHYPLESSSNFVKWRRSGAQEDDLAKGGLRVVIGISRKHAEKDWGKEEDLARQPNTACKYGFAYLPRPRRG
jgi:hypothetical protein